MGGIKGSKTEMGWSVVHRGDFNVVCFPNERSGSRNYSQAMVDFNEFINEEELVDLPLPGGEFTWFRDGARNQFSRINRFLLSSDWEDFLGGTSQSCLPRVT